MRDATEEPGQDGGDPLLCGRVCAEEPPLAQLPGDRGAVSLGRSAVHNYLVAMNESGMIRYDGQTILTPSTEHLLAGNRRIGIVGAVSCGLPKDGDIVVAWVEGEGNTLKRFRREGDTIILHPENSAMPDIRVKECRIQGVAVWVFKKVG